jgi:hypothetical protein
VLLNETWRTQLTLQEIWWKKEANKIISPLTIQVQITVLTLEKTLSQREKLLKMPKSMSTAMICQNIKLNQLMPQNLKTISTVIITNKRNSKMKTSMIKPNQKKPVILENKHNSSKKITSITTNLSIIIKKNTISTTTQRCWSNLLTIILDILTKLLLILRLKFRLRDLIRNKIAFNNILNRTKNYPLHQVILLLNSNYLFKNKKTFTTKT